MNLIQKCFAEFLGAFAIVYCGCGAIAADQISGGAVGHLAIATTFGLTVMVMIYAVGHVSGAHFNPAVTIAFAITRHFPVKQIAPYILAQCLGAICASGIHATILPPLLATQDLSAELNFGVTQPMADMFSVALVCELLATGMLMFVIMAVATDYRAVGEMAGLAIGCTVWVDAICVGPLCGASMNPARSLGPALFSGDWNHFAAYVFGPILGAILGAVFYVLIRCHKETPPDIKGCC